MDDKEFLELLQNGDDCPEKLIRMAETPFQKQVAVEFVLVHKKIEERDEIFAKLDKDVSWCKWLSISVFTIAVLGLLSQWLPQILPFL